MDQGITRLCKWCLYFYKLGSERWILTGTAGWREYTSHHLHSRPSWVLKVHAKALLIDKHTGHFSETHGVLFGGPACMLVPHLFGWCNHILKDTAEHVSHFRGVFEKLSQAGLKLKPSKCRSFQTRISYLGHVVSEKGTETDPKK